MHGALRPAHASPITQPEQAGRAPMQETHKFESRYLDSLIGPYPEGKAVYQERSPINALDRFTTPVAFFQVPPAP